MKRRALMQAGLAGLAPAWRAARAAEVRAGVPIVLPRDFGSHPDFRTEWWYVTGSLQLPGVEAPYGFQLTFFRSRTDLAAGHPSRFAARQLLFAHAALTDPQQGRLRHDQRIARAGFGIAEAAETDTDVRLRDWRIVRRADGSRHVYLATLAAPTQGFAFDFNFTSTQPVLLQGQAGYSRKGPDPLQASHYLSEPQLQVGGELRIDGRTHRVAGRAWLDHEWSEALLHPDAVGWDWIGMNLDDGTAIMAFQTRAKGDGRVLFSYANVRAQGAAARSFTASDLRFEPVSYWDSPRTRARYPVAQRIRIGDRTFETRPVFNDQELDARSTGSAIYWEGASTLLENGRAVGRGYLEMTGYASPLTL